MSHTSPEAIAIERASFNTIMRTAQSTVRALGTLDLAYEETGEAYRLTSSAAGQETVMILAPASRESADAPQLIIGIDKPSRRLQRAFVRHVRDAPPLRPRLMFIIFEPPADGDPEAPRVECELSNPSDERPIDVFDMSYAALGRLIKQGGVNKKAGVFQRIGRAAARHGRRLMETQAALNDLEREHPGSRFYHE